jgi:hypothetical protein
MLNNSPGLVQHHRLLVDPEHALTFSSIGSSAKAPPN